MASVIGMIAAGFAFAGSSKVVNKLFPDDHSSKYAEEVRRHNLALEQFNKAKNEYNKRIQERNEREHIKDRNQQISANQHNKSVKYIDNYNKEINDDYKEPKLEYYINKVNLEEDNADNKEIIKIVMIVGGVLGSYYLYKRSKYKK